MIDYEVKIFNNVYSVAAPLCAENRFISTQITDMTAFPTAALWELDNVTVRDRQSSTPTENFARVTYQCDVYAKTKSECRTVFKAIDERMIQMNFERVSQQYLTYTDNTSIVRYTARYEAEIDTDGRIYRRS